MKIDGLARTLLSGLLLLIAAPAFPAHADGAGKFLVLGANHRFAPVQGEMRILRHDGREERAGEPFAMALGDQIVIPVGGRLELLLESGEHQILDGPGEVKLFSLWDPQSSERRLQLPRRMAAFFSSLWDGVRKLWKA